MGVFKSLKAVASGVAGAIGKTHGRIFRNGSEVGHERDVESTTSKALGGVGSRKIIASHSRVIAETKSVVKPTKREPRKKTGRRYVNFGRSFQLFRLGENGAPIRGHFQTWKNARPAGMSGRQWKKFYKSQRTKPESITGRQQRRSPHGRELAWAIVRFMRLFPELSGGVWRNEREAA